MSFVCGDRENHIEHLDSIFGYHKKQKKNTSYYLLKSIRSLETSQPRKLIDVNELCKSGMSEKMAEAYISIITDSKELDRIMTEYKKPP